MVLMRCIIVIIGLTMKQWKTLHVLLETESYNYLEVDVSILQ